MTSLARCIAPIVEGHSETESVPILLRRLLHAKSVYDLEVAKPFRVRRQKVTKPGELENAIKLVQQSRENVVGILVLLDADDDCPKELAEKLKKRAEKASAGLPVSVVLADKELECWFLGAKESLRDVRGIRNDAQSSPNPKRIRGAKERLNQNMRPGYSYNEVDDQPAFAEKMDIQMASANCRSFRKFIKEVELLAQAKLA